MRIALTGKMRSGKDTVANLIKSKHPEYTTLAFSDGIKKVIQICFPEELEKGSKPRELYQRIGQELRKLNRHVWVNYVDRELQALPDSTNVIVTDCRQLNENKYLRDNGFIVVKVEADKDERLHRIKEAGEEITEEQFNHSTELEVDLIEPDYIIRNIGSIKKLEGEVDRLYEFYDNY
jgi:dephospho-CoA kinase